MCNNANEAWSYKYEPEYGIFFINQTLYTKMNSSPSKTEARKDQYVGDAKQTVGSAVGNDNLQTSGQAQNNNGLIQETTANAANLVTGVVNGATGTVQGVLGGLLGGNDNNNNK